MQRTKMTILTLLLLAGAWRTATASVIGFDVSIDTSTLAGNTGGIYLAFAPGFNSDPASVAIFGFSPGAGLPGAPAFTDGGVTGSLDTGDLLFTNYLYFVNDYGETVIFGSRLSFEVSFNLPDTLTGSSGSELDVQLTQSDLATPVLTGDSSGNIVEISYDRNGVFTATATSAAATITAGGSVPEPATGKCVALLACLLIGLRFVRAWNPNH